ncbi:MAG: dual OB domain-containing protein [Bacillota bacterium]
MPWIDILCLANSTKLGGRCVAGLRTDGSGWIRPVSDAAHGELTAECYLEDGTEARLLDHLRIHVRAPCPSPHQPENWSVGGRAWRLVII